MCEIQAQAHKEKEDRPEIEARTHTHTLYFPTAKREKASPAFKVQLTLTCRFKIYSSC